MDEQLGFFDEIEERDERLSRIKELIPQRMREEIAKIELVAMDSKQGSGLFMSRECANVVITLKPSLYYLSEQSAVLCKLVTLPKSSQTGLVVYFPGRECAFDLDRRENVEMAMAVMVDVLEDLFPAKAFGCCSRFHECSEVGSCLHPHPFYAASCVYRKNLTAGKNFYKDGAET